MAHVIASSAAGCSGNIRLAALLALPCLALACSRSTSEPAPAEPAPIRLSHTFNPAETEALNRALTDWSRAPVEPTLIPFSRGQTLLRQVLRSGRDCPDLARVDATWLPALVQGDLLRPVPDQVTGARQWLPEAAALATVVDGGRPHGLPQSLDGLALIYHEKAVTGVPWPPHTMDELVATARQLAGAGGRTHGLGVRADGYWFVPFLRTWGAELLPESMLEPGDGAAPPSIDTTRAATALARFAGLFGPDGVAPPMPPSGDAARQTARLFRDRSLAVVIDGPWAVADLTGGDTGGIGIAPLPGAPRGGHLLVVPACARNPDGAWALALFLTEPARQADWARRLGAIPTTRDSLPGAGPFVRQFYQALRSATPLPRHPVTPELFEDLSPAVHAVVAGNATPAEALAGVARAWQRLFAKHGIQVIEPGAGVPQPDPQTTNTETANTKTIDPQITDTQTD